MFSTASHFRARSSSLLVLLGVLGSGSVASAGSLPSDFDGDGKTDIAVFYRPGGQSSQTTWHFLESSGPGQGTHVSINWGLSTDKPVPADYDGDGKTDAAIIRRDDNGNAQWWILGSSTGFPVTTFGYITDIPVPRDYNGDGKAEVAVFRPENATWYIQGQHPTFQSIQWGWSTDKPVPGDYDGDGKFDVAVFRPSEQKWYIRQSSNGAMLVATFGVSTDKPVPGDYDGDGKYDVAVFRPSDATWYIRKSSTGTLQSVTWGLSTDIPVPGDYDGDGKFDVAVVRPSTGTWYILRSSISSNNQEEQMRTVSYLYNDIPVPSLYIP